MSIRARSIVGEAVRLPPEIAFLLSGGTPLQLLCRAAELARASGTDAATALLNAGLMAEDVYYRALARQLGTVFLDDIPLALDARYPQMLEVGAAPLAANASPSFVAAPRGRAIARLIETADRLPEKPAITTPTRLRLAAFARHGEAIAEAASDELGRRHPEWSCRPGLRPLDLALVGVIVALLFVLAHLPAAASQVLLMTVQVVTLAMLTVRLSAVAIGAGIDAPKATRLLRDDQLPSYTVIVALYREAKVVSRLVHALAHLDYPGLMEQMHQGSRRIAA